jgi:hypothetical protein
MKKIFLISLAFMLAACGVLQPVQQVAPTPIIATVLVTVMAPTAIVPPTSIPLPTLAPTLPPTEVPTQVPPTAVPPTDAVAVQPTPTVQPVSVAPAASGPIAIAPAFNGKSFKDITASTGLFYLRCDPKEIKFDVTTTDVYITQVEMYFRIRDKHSTDIPGWSWGGTLQTDGLYHFWTTMKGEAVSPDLRKQQGWFDVEFVGLNKLNEAIGRTEKIVDVLSYAIDCK